MIRALFVLLSLLPLIAAEDSKNGFLRTHEEARTLMKDNGGDNFDGLDERHQCVSFDSVEIQGKAGLKSTDDVCRTNSCGGGCCRAFHYLVCDTKNLHPTIPCVCNENTKGNDDRVGDGGTIIVVPDIGVPGPGSQTAPATTPDVVIVVPGTPSTPQAATPGQPTFAVPPSYLQGTDRTDSNGPGVGTSSGKGKKKGKGKGGGGGGSSDLSDRNQRPNANGLIERGPCEPFASVSETKALMSYSDSTCRTNSCDGGCCRSYHWLLCDEDNAFPTIPCVCNQNTDNVPVIPLAPASAPNQVVPNRPTPQDRGDDTPGLPTFVLPPSIEQGPGATPGDSSTNGDKGKNGKNGKDKGGNDKGENIGEDRNPQSDSGLHETHPCIEMESFVGNPFDTRGDSECKTNSCGGGCCRAYNWLLCDTDNSLKTIACICNENTRDRSSWNIIPDIPDDDADNEDKADDGTPGIVDVSIEPTTAPPTSSPDPQTICSNGSWFWNNPSFSTFTECSNDSHCPEKQCCLSRFCLCGKPMKGEEELVCLPSTI